MGQWVGAQGRPKVAYFSKTCPHCDVTSRKPPTETKNYFFSILTIRLAESVKGLNSSLAQSPGELFLLITSLIKIQNQKHFFTTDSNFPIFLRV